jgi:hypothetical protein
MVLGTAKAIHPIPLRMQGFNHALGCRGFVLIHISTQNVTELDAIKSKTVRRFEIKMIFLNFLKIINFNSLNKIIFIYLSNRYIKIKVEHSVILTIIA